MKKLLALLKYMIVPFMLHSTPIHTPTSIKQEFNHHVIESPEGGPGGHIYFVSK